MENELLTRDTALHFMVWSYYYHGILPEKTVSYAQCGKFSAADAARMDAIKDLLFKCFEQESVLNACKQFQLAKMRNEPCPFPQAVLDNMFAKEKSGADEGCSTTD